MTHPLRRRRLSSAAVGLLAGGLALSLAGVATSATSAPGRADRSQGSGLTAAQSAAAAAGFQLAPKGSAAARSAKSDPNPYLAEVPDLSTVDYATWRQRLAARATQRTSSKAHQAARASANKALAAKSATVVWDEQEPAGTNGSNDAFDTAERITPFGTAKSKNNVVRIIGQTADLASGAPSALAPGAEDNGAIDLATDTGIEGVAAVTTTGVLGDGPHGVAPGDGSNDFDFYAVDVPAGQSVVADTGATASGVDTILAVYAADGTLVAADDDGGDAPLTSKLTYTPQSPGTYYVLVAGYTFLGPLPEDPFDSGSGVGGADTGDYALSVSVQPVDRDEYAVKLRPGDVVGAVANGAADSLAVTKPDRSERVGSAGLDASSLYPANSPLPGGGNTTLAYVAEEAGWYVVSVAGATGDYSVQVEGYRPGAETDSDKTQTVYLDFEGGRVNTGTWGGPGVRQLSPFSAFLGKWGIARARERAMITKITAQVRQNIADEVAAGGLNPGLKVRVVNSRTNPEVKGQSNVSRIVIGGTIAESGIETIGIAQYIDPGNYGHEDAALVLLDVLSDPDGPASLNTYLTGSSDRERFVAQALGNVTAHEIGHTVGSYHTDNLSDVVNLMDSGGANFQNLFGVGPDGVGGTADDLNVRFTTDDYAPAEGFTGLENTLNVTAWAYPGS